MNVILMIFGMSFVDGIDGKMPQPLKVPETTMVEVVKFQPKKDEPDEYSWLWLDIEPK